MCAGLWSVPKLYQLTEFCCMRVAVQTAHLSWLISHSARQGSRLCIRSRSTLLCRQLQLRMLHHSQDPAFYPERSDERKVCHLIRSEKAQPFVGGNVFQQEAMPGMMLGAVAIVCCCICLHAINITWVCQPQKSLLSSIFSVSIICIFRWKSTTPFGWLFENWKFFKKITCKTC